jgi:hypothetical protein
MQIGIPKKIKDQEQCYVEVLLQSNIIAIADGLIVDNK